MRAIPHYRLRFLEIIRELLNEQGVDLVLIYGQVGRKRAMKADTVDVPWATRVRNVILQGGPLELYWQPCLSLVEGASLVIVTQEAKLLTNYVLHWRRVRGGLRVAYWGHGGTYLQGPLATVVGPIKDYLAKHVDWWFAYTSRSASYLAQIGFPESRVTLVNNAIDTATLHAAHMSLNTEDMERERQRLGALGRNVAVFIGGMYREKRLVFLLEACEAVRARLPDFECLFIGDGPESGKVREAAARLPWIHYLGPRFGADKVVALALAKVMLMPGLVGLALLDSFAMELPILTTDVPYHSPEIEYLEDGENGIMLPRDCGPEEYGAEVASLLGDERRLGALRKGCREAARRYTIEDMASRFASGVAKALNEARVARASRWFGRSDL